MRKLTVSGTLEYYENSRHQELEYFCFKKIGWRKMVVEKHQIEKIKDHVTKNISHFSGQLRPMAHVLFLVQLMC